MESRPPPFRPPTFEEVKAYCQQARQPIDVQRFIDFYASKGWKVGSEGMKDWQAAVRNWRRRDLERRNGRPSREDDLLAEIHDAESAP